MSLPYSLHLGKMFLVMCLSGFSLSPPKPSPASFTFCKPDANPPAYDPKARIRPQASETIQDSFF